MLWYSLYITPIELCPLSLCTHSWKVPENQQKHGAKGKEGKGEDIGGREMEREREREREKEREKEREREKMRERERGERWCEQREKMSATTFYSEYMSKCMM